MKQTGQINKKRVVFSKWSRKGYSAFASLNKVVNIASLSVDISNTSLKKNLSLIPLFSPSADDKNKKEDDVRFEEISDNQLFKHLLPLVVINPVITPKQEFTIHFNNGKPIFCKAQNMGFLFLNHSE